MLKAITRAAGAVDARIKALNAAQALSDPSRPAITTAYFFDHLAAPHDSAVVVEEADFLAARDELVPSVSVQELEHYDGVRRAFEQDGQKKENAPAARGTNGIRDEAVAAASASDRQAMAASEDDFVLRTEALSLGDGHTNGIAHDGSDAVFGSLGAVKGIGKGKGKAVLLEEAGPDLGNDINGFGNAAADDENLYE